MGKQDLWIKIHELCKTSLIACISSRVFAYHFHNRFCNNDNLHGILCNTIRIVHLIWHSIVIILFYIQFRDNKWDGSKLYQKRMSSSRHILYISLRRRMAHLKINLRKKYQPKQKTEAIRYLRQYNFDHMFP